MTENSSSDVGGAAIDAYLDSVEQALLAAHAPRGDRVQVLQDLESQIADMLASGPQPLTEEAVQSVIAKLEPPSHFAATYGNGREARAAWGVESAVSEIARRSWIRWPWVAAVSCTCLGLGCLGVLLTNGPNGPDGILIALLLLVGFALTPLALWKAAKQLQAEPGDRRDRNLVLISALVYAVVVPALVMGFFTLATHGFLLVPFGLGAFVYLQYVLVRRLHRRLSDALPPQPGGDAAAHTGAPAVGSAMSMGAV